MIYVSSQNSGAGYRRGTTDSGNDVLMVRQMSLAVLAAVDLVAIEVDVVRKTHGRW
jgi:hypothetical protein